MQRFLAYDAGCGTCTNTADTLRDLLGTDVELRALQDARVRALLEQAGQPLRWEPMLLQVGGDAAIRVSRGVSLRFRLVRLLGIRRSWKLLKHLGRTTSGPVDASRRSAMRLGVLGLGVALLPFNGMKRALAAHAKRATPLDRPSAERLLSRAEAHPHFAEARALLRGHREQPTGASLTFEDGSTRDIATVVHRSGDAVAVLFVEQDADRIWASVSVLDLGVASTAAAILILDDQGVQRVTATREEGRLRLEGTADGDFGTMHDCYTCWCVEYAGGHTYESCRYWCSVSCGFIPNPLGKAACIAFCQAACWVPPYCVEAECQPLC